MILRTLLAFVIVIASLPSCNQNECGDINTLELSSPVCFAVTYDCTSPATVIQSTTCGGGYSDFALNVGTNATCTIQVACPDGTMQSITAEWTLNASGCAPVFVSGPFDHTVCGGDGGAPPIDAATLDDAGDAGDAASE
jgi:hypothetical protein